MSDSPRPNGPPQAHLRFLQDIIKASNKDVATQTAVPRNKTRLRTDSEGVRVGDGRKHSSTFRLFIVPEFENKEGSTLQFSVNDDDDETDNVANYCRLSFTTSSTEEDATPRKRGSSEPDTVKSFDSKRVPMLRARRSNSVEERQTMKSFDTNKTSSWREKRSSKVEERNTVKSFDSNETPSWREKRFNKVERPNTVNSFYGNETCRAKQSEKCNRVKSFSNETANVSADSRSGRPQSMEFTTEHQLNRSSNTSVIAWLKMKNFQEKEKRKVKKWKMRVLKRVAQEEAEQRQEREEENARKFSDWLQAKKRAERRARKASRAEASSTLVETRQEESGPDSPPPNYTVVPTFKGTEGLTAERPEAWGESLNIEESTSTRNKKVKVSSKKKKRPKTSEPIEKRNVNETRPQTSDARMGEASKRISYDAWIARKRVEHKREAKQRKRDTLDSALTEVISKLARKRIEIIRQGKKEVDTGLETWRAKNRISSKDVGTKSKTTRACEEPTRAPEDPDLARDDHTRARDGPNQARDDQTQARDDQTRARDDQTQARDDQTPTRDDQTLYGLPTEYQAVELTNNRTASEKFSSNMKIPYPTREQNMTEEIETIRKFCADINLNSKQGGSGGEANVDSVEGR